MKCLEIFQTLVKLMINLRLKKKSSLRRWWAKPHFYPQVRSSLGAYDIFCIYFEFTKFLSFVIIIMLQILIFKPKWSYLCPWTMFYLGWFHAPRITHQDYEHIEGLLCLWGGMDRTARRSAEQRSALGPFYICVFCLFCTFWVFRPTYPSCLLSL